MNLFGELERPLADRLRPKSLDEFAGQEHITGQDKFVRTLIEQHKPVSLILWGPPGTGKTTLARIIAESSGLAYEEISAVTSGLPEVKKVIDRASERRRMGQGTLLFVDEIHRFNKAQQDAFLPHMESGLITLVGATTENPSFEVIGPLLSRSRVVTLEPLSSEDLGRIIKHGASELKVKIDEKAVTLLADMAAGDARVALGGLETASQLVENDKTISPTDIKQALQRTSPKYDKGAEYHYNLISAYIKSLRGGAVDAALFYLARMLEGGEDPKFVARRMVVFASEDIGVADNSMLNLAVSTFQAVERIGMPESRIILGHATVALATAPKDRSSYDAISAAGNAAKENPSAQPPLHLRNAPTNLMKELDYGKGYKWEPGFEHPEGFLPKEIISQRFWLRPKPPKKP